MTINYIENYIWQRKICSEYAVRYQELMILVIIYELKYNKFYHTITTKHIRDVLGMKRLSVDAFNSLIKLGYIDVKSINKKQNSYDLTNDGELLVEKYVFRTKK